MTSLVRDGTLGPPASEPTGADERERFGFVGSLVRRRLGAGDELYNVFVRNGRLTFQGDGQDLRLSERTPGLFFTPDGDTFGPRSPVASFRNISMYESCR